MARGKTSSEVVGTDLGRLQRLLDRPELERVVDALRDRLERGGGERVSIADPTEPERRAADELLGRRPSSGRRLIVPLAQLEAILQRAGVASGLEAAITALRGPLRDRPAEREQTLAAWRALFERHRPEAERLGACAWLDGLEKDGLLKRVAGRDPVRAETLLGQALGVLKRLPAQGSALSTLAADCLGDAHGLDAGRPVASLLRRALTLSALALSAPTPGAGPPDASDDELWAGVGVLIGGGITSTALVLNLTADGDTVPATCLRAAAAVGEPIYLTLRHLVRQPVLWCVGPGPISVCENPAVVAEAANRLGNGCRPLICTRGQPSAAVTTLLGQLVRAGATIRYHGDFDWAGIRIANGVIARHGALPWRMAAADYRNAEPSGKALSEDAADAIWDPNLAPAMRARGQAIEEERLLGVLLGDLISLLLQH